MQAQQALMYDHLDSMVFQIRDADGRVIAGADELAAAPALRDGERGFSTAFIVTSRCATPRCAPTAGSASRSAKR
jgi:hypothetical protein